MSLRDKLEAQKKITAQRLGADGVRLYDAFVASLESSGVLSGSLKAGSRVPEFMLPSADGTLISSGELLARGPMVVSFFRGDWCPYCNLELAALEETLPEIEALGATLVAVTPDTGAALISAKRRHKLSYCVLNDADNGLGLRFGVVYRVPDAIRDLYLGIGLDLGARHGNVAWFLPVPATYIVGQDGLIRHAELDVDFRRRMEPAAILDVLRGMTGGAPSGG